MINVIPENYVTEILGIAFLFLRYFDGLELFLAKLYEKILLNSNFLQNHSHSFMSNEIKMSLISSGSNYRKIISWWLFTNQGS